MRSDNHHKCVRHSLSSSCLFFAVWLGLSILLPATVAAGTTSLYHSVEQALNYNPQIQAFTHQQQAAQYDLKKSRAGYLPSVDLLLGYGVEQYSDDATRRPGADPNDSDWDTLGDATLKLTQKLYDGGETGSQVSIQKALLESARYRLQGVAQDVALQAISAHLDLFRQRELVALAEKNLHMHREIHQLLADREQAGAGNIADVTRTQAQLARAQSILHLSQADLNRAIAGYIRVVGQVPDPENMTFAGVPDTLPQTPEEIITLMESGNPELLSLSAEINEAEKRVGLARSAYKPKIDLELSSRYNDQLEGNQSWQNANEAMLNLSWNLFNGGADRANEKAFLARKYQFRSAHDNKLFELRSQISADWAVLQALQAQRAAYRDAVEYSKKTFDAYLKQFSVSQRSLLDVLSIENEYFQSAGQLVNVAADQTLTAYRLLATTGNLHVPRGSGVRGYPEDLSWLKQALAHPGTVQVGTADSGIEVLPEENIKDFISQWRDAWSQQDVEAYLSCYGENFEPSNGDSHRAWQSKRSKALTAPVYISLSLSHLLLHKLSDSAYRAEFIQNYRSDRYSDQVKKTLLLEAQNNAWKIVSEQATSVGSLIAPGQKSRSGASDQAEVMDELEISARLADAETEVLPAYAVIVGPCINKLELDYSRATLNSFSLQFEQRTRTGEVMVIRLQEGVYPNAEARKKLLTLKTVVDSAYLLPEVDNKLGLYLGSFHDPGRAERFLMELQQQGLRANLVTAAVEMQGEVLISQYTDAETAQLLINKIAEINVVAKTKL